MKTRRHQNRILLFQHLGFGLLITLSWLDELVDLPQRLFGGADHTNWHESALESAAIVLVWFLLHRLTRRLLDRLHYLAGYLRICAWCKKVSDGEQWTSLENYFSQHLNAQATHGACPACMEKLLNRDLSPPAP